MQKRILGALTLGIFLSSAVLAGGAEGSGAWLGTRLDVAQTAFCRANGCILTNVRQNNESTMGWSDGTKRTYMLRGGARLELDVRPDGWISNTFLFFPNQPRASGPAVITPKGHRLAAEFLSAATGRRFMPEAVAACEAEGLAANSRNPDFAGPLQPLSRWTTPMGLPYLARCGVSWQLGVWAGWMQG